MCNFTPPCAKPPRLTVQVLLVHFIFETNICADLFMEKKNRKIYFIDFKQSSRGKFYLFGFIWGIFTWARLTNKYFIIVRINGNYNSNICNNANFNWKSLKSQKMQVTIIFNYSSLPGQDNKLSSGNRLGRIWNSSIERSWVWNLVRVMKSS